MKIALGPLLFFWPQDDLRSFYARVAQNPAIDVVYLGDIMGAMRAAGIDLVRLSPQTRYLDDIIAAFDAARHGRPQAGADGAWNENRLVDGYWLGKPGSVHCDEAPPPGALWRDRRSA